MVVALAVGASVLAGCDSDVETVGGAGTGGSGATGAHGGTGGTGNTGNTGGTGGAGNTGNVGGIGGSGANGGIGGAGGAILPTGDCDGPEDCDGSPCVEITPGGWRSCTFTPPEATTCTNPQFDECCNTGECLQGTCLLAPLVPYCGGPQPLEYNMCGTDQCQSDTICMGGGYDGVCLPAPMLGRQVRACMSVSCRVNADCTAEGGGYCAPIDDPCCNDAAGLYCVYPSNGCRSSADCPSGYCQPSAEGTHCEPGGPACPA